MPDTFRAADLTREQIGRLIRVDSHEGRLGDLYPIDDLFVQVLLVTDGETVIPVVGMGEPVEFLDEHGPP